MKIMGINAIAIGPDLDNRTASRKADREALARAFIGVAQRHGAQIERREKSRTLGYCGAGVHLEFRLNGVGGMVDIDDLHGGDFALIHWFNSERGARGFLPGFPGASSFGGKPHHKATSHPRGWHSLAQALDKGLELAASGNALAPIA